jgi:hypothetical protein
MGMTSENLFFYDIVLPGMLFMLLGYMQWFIFIPRVKQYLKAKKRSHHIEKGE